MFRVIKKQVRPNMTVDFFSIIQGDPTVAQEYTAWVNENYIQTGKLLNSQFEVSENNLELTMTTDWATEADLIAWRQSPNVIESVLNQMEAYADANGIEITTILAAEVV